MRSISADVGLPASSGSVSGHPVDPWTVALLVLRAMVLVSVVVGLPDFQSPLALRYVQIAHTGGIPYRDFPVEYPILDLGIAEAVGSWTPGIARALLAMIAFAGDLVAFVVIRRTWGSRASRTYLILGSPLLVFMYRRSDLVSAGLATLGMASVWRHRDVRGGSWLAVATLAKVWPAALLPALYVRRSYSAIISFFALLVGGSVAWLAVGGVGDVGQVTTFRGATGWELESTVGAVVWAVTGEHRFEQGANRTGFVPTWARLLLLVLLAAGSLAIWAKARRTGDDPCGPPALAAVALLLGLSPLFSPQYVIWLLPWGALATRSGRKWMWLTMVPVMLTAVMVASWFLHLGLGPGRTQLLLCARNLSVLVIPVLYIVQRVKPRDPPVRQVPGRTHDQETAVHVD